MAAPDIVVHLPFVLLLEVVGEFVPLAFLLLGHTAGLFGIVYTSGR